MESGETSRELLHAIHGDGAFRKFKDAVRRRGIESDWFAFRTEALREIAVEWCGDNQIAWE